ncbi:MAG: phosphotransferase [Marmoricola sp.]
MSFVTGRPAPYGEAVSHPEEPLVGGNVSRGVVRVCDTVRKPSTKATDSVLAFLTHLDNASFDGAPRAMGRDELDRMTLEYVPGPLAHDLPLLDIPGLRRVGALIRRLHDLSEAFVPPRRACWEVVIPPDEELLICHHDLAPWNLVLGRDRWVFIDWDNAGPGSRLWDLAYAAHGFVGMAPGNDASSDADRLAALVDGYGLAEDDRERLVQLLPRRIRSMFDLLVSGHITGTQPWSRLYAEGHADHWGPTAEYAKASSDRFRDALLRC